MFCIFCFSCCNRIIWRAYSTPTGSLRSREVRRIFNYLWLLEVRLIIFYFYTSVTLRISCIGSSSSFSIILLFAGKCGPWSNRNFLHRKILIAFCIFYEVIRTVHLFWYLIKLWHHRCCRCVSADTIGSRMMDTLFLYLRSPTPLYNCIRNDVFIGFCWPAR